METVKVDIQKLQLLNDRIAQTIEALNQVRMSVHGIQHATAQPTPWGYGTQLGGYPQQSLGFSPQFTGYGIPFGSPYAQPFQTPFLGGLSHTTAPFTTTPSFTGNPFATPFTGGLQHTTAPTPTPFLGNGLSHDPTWAMRAMQAFPFAQWQYPVTLS